MIRERITFTDFNDVHLIRLLLVITGLLVICRLLSVLTQGASIHFERFFDLDGESNIQTWFSSLLMILSGLVALRCVRLSRDQSQKMTWTALSATLFYLSCDEVAMIHEIVGQLFVKHFFWKQWLRDVSEPTWPLVLGPIFVLAVVWIAPRLRRSLKDSQKAQAWLGSGALLWIFGSIGFDVSQHFLSEPWLWTKKVEIVFEESFELIGAILFLGWLLLHEKFIRECHCKMEIGIKPCQA